MQHNEEEAYWIYNGQKDEVPATVRRVKIADNVTEIPNYAFHSHLELEEVILSSSVQVIGKYAFSQCKQLESILYQQSLEGDDGDEEKEEEDAMPSNVKVIERGAFYGCNLLARLGLKEGLERIEQDAFTRCESLTEVEIPSTVQVIDDDVFQGCRRLARLVLNEGRLERIGKDAFYGCESLTEVEIPSTVKVIGVWAFGFCRRLARLVLKEGSLERIGKDAFTRCESLTEVDIPSTVKVIDDDAFQGCRRLARLGLKEGRLERIGKDAFYGCDSLSHVRISQSVSSLAIDAFVKCSNLISIERPEECSFGIELSGCQSVVNLAGGQIAFSAGEWERFFQSSKLGSLVDDEADLNRKLNHRFDNSPLNKLCYYQSYLDDAMAELRSLMMEGGPPLAAATEVDEFGMTPLHILSLSQTLNLDMLLAVMDAGKPGHMVRVRDSFGSTPMEYLCMNRMPNANDVIRRLFQTRFEQVLGLDQFWEFDMLLAIDETLAGDSWWYRRREIGKVIRQFERKDILSLLELCLWKVKIDEVSSEEQTVDREFCRVHSGASIVIPHVLSFFL